MISFKNVCVHVCLYVNLLSAEHKKQIVGETFNFVIVNRKDTDMLLEFFSQRSDLEYAFALLQRNQIYQEISLWGNM